MVGKTPHCSVPTFYVPIADIPDSVSGGAWGYMKQLADIFIPKKVYGVPNCSVLTLKATAQHPLVLKPVTSKVKHYTPSLNIPSSLSS